MEEKTIIEGVYNYQFDVAKKMKFFLGMSAACFGVMFITMIFFNGTDFTEPLCFGGMGLGILFIVIALVFVVIYLYCRYTKIVVTDKRVYGTTIGKHVDLPLDSITSCGTTFFLGVTVATASGLIAFRGIDNRNQVYSAIKQLLVDRQSKPAVAEKAVSTVTNITQEVSNADELKKYKELMDEGIISQEEFEAKKKQLLGL